jgi:prepilin-type N-terminal cleavage/methylation domain-containing protein
MRVANFASQKGFGLIEVLFAAVVLGFLIVGLTRLQIGNRESILRVRARDAANTFAQETIDSISALGSAAKVGQNNFSKSREFTSGIIGNAKVDYKIAVDVNDVDATSEEGKLRITEETELTRAQTTDKLDVVHKFARQVDVTVSWNFKNNSKQSINMSSVIK